MNISDATGTASFRLPSGDYQIVAHYTSDYWLTMTRTKASIKVSFTESTTKTIILTNFPSEIWTAVGFILTVSTISIAVTAIAIFYLIYRRTH